jgi:hypothetical protein
MCMTYGENVIYDELLEEFQLPPMPDLIPAAVRASLNPNAKPTPFMKAWWIAMVGHNAAIVLSDPRLQPINVQLTKRSTGFTLSADMPPSEISASADSNRVDINYALGNNDAPRFVASTDTIEIPEPEEH